MRRLIFLIASAASVFMLFSCGDLELPESISVKTNAEFQLPLGTASYNTADKLKELRSTIQDELGNTASVYTYAENHSDDVLRYLVHFPAFKVPVNVGDYLSDMGFDKKFEAMNQSYEFTAGEPISMDLSQTISLTDFAKNAAGDNTTVQSPSDVVIPESVTVMSESEMPDINVAGNTTKITFSRMYYDSGVLKVTFTKKDSVAYTSDYHLNVKASIYSGTEPEPVAESAVTDITQNNVVSIPLTGSKGIPQSFVVKFSGSASGGSSGKIHSFDIKGEAANISVSKIVNLNVHDEDYMENAGFDLNSEISFQNFVGLFNEATIDDGHLIVNANAPSGWKGVTLDIDSLSIAGGCVSNFTSTSTVAPTPAGKLIDKDYILRAKITPQSDASQNIAHVTGKVKVNVSNATIICTDNVRVNVAFNVSKIATAKIDLEGHNIKGFSLPTDGSTGSIELPGELLKAVDYIDFNGEGNRFGIKCKVTNTLPEGNDIPLVLKGFKKPDNPGYYYNVNAELPAGSNSAEQTWTNQFKLTFPSYVEGQKRYLEMSATIENAGNFPVSNIVLGSSYSVGISDMEVIYDWKEISLKLGENLSCSGEMELPFDLNSIMQDGFEGIDTEQFSNVSISNLPMYLYAVKPTGGLGSSFSNVSFSGKIYLSYKENGTQKYKDLLNNGTISTNEPSTPGEIALKQSSIPLPDDTEQVVYGDSSNVADYLGSNYINVADVMKLTNATDLKAKFDIGLNDGSSIKIQRSQISEEDEGCQELAVDIVAIVPFDLELLAPIRVEVMRLTDDHYNDVDENGYCSDLLQREDASTFDEYAKYVEHIKYVGFKYKLNNTLIPNLTIGLDIDDRYTEGDEDSRKLHGTGFHEYLAIESSNDYKLFGFQGESLSKVMTNWPFHPDINVQLGRDLREDETGTGKYSQVEHLTVHRSGLSDEKGLGVGLIVSAKMDGEPISVWQKSKEGGEQ